MSAPWQRYEVTTEIALTIEVRNPDAIERVTGPQGDEWRSQFYRLRTVEDVLEHWAYNALVNGIQDVSRLEGWADLAPTDVVFYPEHSDLIFTRAAGTPGETQP